jgi:hypothetical protein
VKVAVISDPHGDLLAFNQVIADLELAETIDEVLIGGAGQEFASLCGLDAGGLGAPRSEYDPNS